MFILIFLLQIWTEDLSLNYMRLQLEYFWAASMVWWWSKFFSRNFISWSEWESEPTTEQEPTETLQSARSYPSKTTSCRSWPTLLHRSENGFGTFLFKNFLRSLVAYDVLFIWKSFVCSLGNTPGWLSGKCKCKCKCTLVRLCNTFFLNICCFLDECWILCFIIEYEEFAKVWLKEILFLLYSLSIVFKYTFCSPFNCSIDSYKFKKFILVFLW